LLQRLPHPATCRPRRPLRRPRHLPEMPNGSCLRAHRSQASHRRWPMSRSLVSVDVSVEREDGVPTLHFTCDCGTLTHVVVSNLPSMVAAGGLQFAYTCNGCASSHWLTLTPAQHNVEIRGEQ